MPNEAHEERAGFSRLCRFADWLNPDVPRAAAGVYAIWRGDELIYCGMSGRSIAAGAELPDGKYGLVTQLKSRASGRLSGDQFCVYVAIRPGPAEPDPGRTRSLRLRKAHAGCVYAAPHSPGPRVPVPYRVRRGGSHGARGRVQARQHLWPGAAAQSLAERGARQLTHSAKVMPSSARPPAWRGYGSGGSGAGPRTQFLMWPHR